ncbi:MAG: hypothetical protein OEW35_12535 [Gammaproteobacteria bacterium]|nr:hypothetical protein [Gammaproteobacteria bacterium]MDH4253670.1 hypothetical protein [Gammaproteobacteria bacterium]MDH5311668.1 hypothetical protein [Gammaproteobacteria bacterium]MDH5502370.1 hypothetical protein [Gammaproteobacteria bacterium]
MQDRNGSKWGKEFVAVDGVDSALVDEARDGQARTPNGDGWQQYRRWISKAPAPRQRRGGIDPTLYTWKGYRSWTEQIKRNWPDKA